MYEGKKREKMYYSSYLVMVEAKVKKKKNADSVSFSTAVQILFILF